MSNEVLKALASGVGVPLISALATAMLKTAARATPRFAEDFALGFEMFVAAIALQLGLVAASLSSSSQPGGAPTTGGTLVQVGMAAGLGFVALATATGLRGY